MYMKLRILAVIVFIVTISGIANSAETPPVYNLSVSFDIENNLLKADAQIMFSEDSKRKIYVGQLRIMSIKFNDQPLEPEVREGIFEINGRGILEITYEGPFQEEQQAIEIEDIENARTISKNIICDKGISLTCCWYPSFEGMSNWNLKVSLPKDFKAISEADEIIKEETAQGTEYSFYFPYPLGAIHLVAGPYVEQRDNHKGIEIYAYFFSEDISLAEEYLDYTKKYLSLYGELLSSYPYKRFSIVENIMPTGFSMPTFTVLGRRAINLPFILETYLGHEILHQWFGNYVYGDYKSGNWLGGITSYLSDYLYEEQKGTGWDFRKKNLIDYQSHVTPSKETSLKDFQEKNDFASTAIGYGKGSMVFHMLNNLVGEDIFYNALRGLIEEKKHSEASWEDVKMAFEKTSGKNLDDFFNQWIEKKGIPSLLVSDPRVTIIKGVPTVSFEVLQIGQPYNFSLPVKVITDNGEIKDILHIEKSKQEFEIPVDAKPLRIIFDEDYDLMRELTDKEFPPVLARLLGDEMRLLIFSEGEREKYADFIDIFSKEGLVMKEEREIKDEDIRDSSLLVLGYESPIVKRLFGKVSKSEGGFSLVVRPNPLNTKKVVVYVDGDSKEEVDQAVTQLFRYRQYSRLQFKGGENREKETEKSERGIVFGLYEPVLGISPKAQIGLAEIMNTISDKSIIFVGEKHPRYEDHRIQLEIIMELFQRGKKFAIGMEMFQRPFQKALDDYLSGIISEREFMKASEYFKRWKFDYNFYREIIEFAKAKGIPIVALNLQEEIVKKVAEGGLDVLTQEEKREIPQDMDMADEHYRERLMKVFKLHEKSIITNFEYFYQSQILWDETMAHSIAQFFTDHPDYQMVVLAGEQHIIFSSGIPKRSSRITGKEYAILLNGIPEDLDNNVGDFILFPEPMTLPTSPILGVLLQEDEGSIKVKHILPGSIASRAGINKDDIFISIDDWRIESVEDVKIALFDKKAGETVTVKISRKRFFWGKKEFEFQVTL